MSIKVGLALFYQRCCCGGCPRGCRHSLSPPRVLLVLLLLLLMMMMMVVVVVMMMVTTTMIMMIIMTTMTMLFWDLHTCSTRARWILVLWPPGLEGRPANL